MHHQRPIRRVEDLRQSSFRAMLGEHLQDVYTSCCWALLGARARSEHPLSCSGHHSTTSNATVCFRWGAKRKLTFAPLSLCNTHVQDTMTSPPANLQQHKLPACLMLQKPGSCTSNHTSSSTAVHPSQVTYRATQDHHVASGSWHMMRAGRISKRRSSSSISSPSTLTCIVRGI